MTAYLKVTLKGIYYSSSILLLGNVGRHGQTQVYKADTEYFDSISEHPLRVSKSNIRNLEINLI